ncbi:MAG: YjfB family protein [Fibrobacterota bacterium]
MGDMSIGNIKGLQLAVEVNSRLQKNAMDNVEQSIGNLLESMPKSANPAHLGNTLDIRA